MSTTNTQSLDLNENRQGKFKQIQRQKKTIFEYLKQYTATASMVAEITGVPQKSICRYKRDLEKQGLLYEVEKKLCRLTGFSAWYLTTNTELFPKSNQ
jgi:predicted transcriptional regulator of viral defense system